MAIAFPASLLKFTSLTWQIAGTTRDGGRGQLGGLQVVASPASYWIAKTTLSVAAMSWNSMTEKLVFDAFMAELGGRAGVCNLPFFDARGPAQLLGSATPTSAVFSGAANTTNATQVKLQIAGGRVPTPGQVFTTSDGWMHRIFKLVSTVGAVHTVDIRPWLRASYSSGSAVNMDSPTSRMRLVDDLSGALTIQARQPFANPTLEWEEAF